MNIALRGPLEELRQLLARCDSDHKRRDLIERDHGGPPGLPESCDHCLTALERDYYRAALARAAFVAEHLMQMIDPQTWRDTGGDDSQGHYEGDYHADATAAEISEWKAMTE